MRAFIIFVLLMAMAGPCAAIDANEFLISFWSAPPLQETNDARYAEIKEAGFNLVFPPASDTDVEGNKKILDLCRKYGMKALLYDRRIMNVSHTDPNFEKNLDSVVADYASHPALYGYHVVDEPNSAAFPNLAAITQYLLKKDPARVPYINLLPTYGGPGMFGNKTYEQHVSQYMRQVKNPVLSYDHYLQMTNFHGNEFFENIEIIRRQALSHKVPFVNIILVTPHDPYRDPTMDDLRWQVYNTLVYGARGIVYFTYWTLESDIWNFHNGIIEKNGERTWHYDMVKQLNHETLQLAKTLTKVESKGVYHTAPLPPEAKPIPDGWLVRKVDGAKLVIGHFTDSRNRQYLMFVNKDMRQSATAKITMDPMALPLREIPNQPSVKGELLPISPMNTVEITLKPGEGKLFMVDRYGNYPFINLPIFKSYAAD